MKEIIFGLIAIAVVGSVLGTVQALWLGVHKREQQRYEDDGK